MSPRSPARLIFTGLALAGMAKAGIALYDAGMPQGTGARAPVLTYAAEAAPKAPEPMAVAATDPDPIPASCEMPEEMLTTLTRERELVAVQKDALAQRASEVELAAEQLAVDTARLETLKADLEALLARVAAARTDDVDRLVALYRNMKPKEAALTMNDLDIEVSVMVLGTMSERDAAPILAKLSPVRAQAISRIILERSKLPGDQRLEGIKLQ
ncbi:hypothetical protein LCGC14_2220020 [marine sediment metagenome]|uniref:Magnesium transporter MgtE intracellular domain-containing protein n=1 Tax=marine sediment metagenome TaxID=412755 RepID=A0A0F9FNU8_9ZZZZ